MEGAERQSKIKGKDDSGEGKERMKGKSEEKAAQKGTEWTGRSGKQESGMKRR